MAAHPLRWRLLTELAGSDHRVRELVARVGEPQNLVSYHLRLLREAGLVTSARSTFDGRDSYYRLDLDRCAEELARAGTVLHPALHLASGPGLHSAPAGGSRLPTTSRSGAHSGRVAVLFLCTGNSARSPIAEALLRHRANGRVTVASAGSHPRAEVHPHAVRVLRETFDLDISGRRPRHLDTLARRRFTHVITVCDRVREVCPEFAHGPRRAHWSTADPSGSEVGYAAFRRTALDLDSRIRHLLAVLTVTDSSQVRP